jgi:hypothetical protein
VASLSLQPQSAVAKPCTSLCQLASTPCRWHLRSRPQGQTSRHSGEGRMLGERRPLVRPGPVGHPDVERPGHEREISDAVFRARTPASATCAAPHHLPPPASGDGEFFGERAQSAACRSQKSDALSSDGRGASFRSMAPSTIRIRSWGEAVVEGAIDECPVHLLVCGRLRLSVPASSRLASTATATDVPVAAPACAALSIDEELARPIDTPVGVGDPMRRVQAGRRSL